MIDQSEMFNFWLRMEKWLPKVKQIFFECAEMEYFLLILNLLFKL